VAITILTMAIVMMAIQFRGGRAGKPTGRYFMDLSTGKLFVGPLAGLPPIAAPDGGPDKGVLAHVYACGKCAEGQLKISHIETLSEEARNAIANKDADPMAAGRLTIEGRLIAHQPANPGEEPAWINAASPEAVQILGGIGDACGGKPAKTCMP